MSAPALSNCINGVRDPRMWEGVLSKMFNDPGSTKEFVDL